MKISICPTSNITAAFGTVMFILFTATAGYSAAITLSNPSFESPDTVDGSYNGEVDGWGETGGAPLRGLYDPESSSYAGATGNTVPLPGTATGFQVGFVSAANALLSQSAGALLPNTTYTLTAAFGDPLLGIRTGWIQLVNTTTGDVLAENRDFSGVDGTFVDRTASFTSGSSVSGDLIIVLRSNGNETHYDNVRLDASPVPEPSFSITFLCGAVALGFFRHFGGLRKMSAA